MAAVASSTVGKGKDSKLSEKNFTAALDVEGSTPLTSVQLDGLVVLKIIKHCRESFPSSVTGQLLGLDVDGVLEVTNCFPFPGSKEDDDENVDGAQYQLDMLRCLREINVDNNTVGWYYSTYLGSSMNQSLIDTQFNYQKGLGNKSIVIVHDVSRSAQGNLSLRAFRLKNSFMEAYKEKKFTTESLAKAKLNFSNIFEELPIQIHNSHLLTAMLYELEDLSLKTGQPIEGTSALRADDDLPTPLAPNFDMLELSLDPYIEKNLELLMESIDEHQSDQNNHQYWQRSVAREQAKIQQYLQKRRQENVQRQAQGLPPLPEEDVSQMFRIPPEPSRLDSLLINAQIHQYCRQINQFVGPSLSKLYLAGELQK
ncbi:uncharacterized protein VTP21DRAFT_7340 [Calcarisporiella thermophila]|uniref:uncharacterized protein n=1 Tax=Calcarisporiella thermophila TaxID=911321 RepID=UPI003742CF8F